MPSVLITGASKGIGRVTAKEFAAEVAVAVADAAELDDPPLRIPVGAMAQAVIAARKAAPDDVPFRRAG